MGSCKCGSRTVKFTPGQVKKAPIKKGNLSGNDAKGVTQRSKNLAAKARRKANANAVPCNCTP